LWHRNIRLTWVAQAGNQTRVPEVSSPANESRDNITLIYLNTNGRAFHKTGAAFATVLSPQITGLIMGQTTDFVLYILLR